MMARLFALMFLAACTVLGHDARAQALATPTGPVLLTVSGAIANTNAPGKAEFDRAMFEALGLSDLTTSTPYTDGKPTFRGIVMSKVLDAVGATGQKLRAIAANGYQIELDVDEMRRYPILIALEQDGKPLRLRDRGPLWVILPSDQYPEFQANSQNFKSIWQLTALEVR